MQYEFRGRTLQEAVRNATRGTHSDLSTKQITPPCEELKRLISRAINQIEEDSQWVEGVAEDLERRVERLGAGAREAALSLGIDIALTVSSIGNVVKAARALQMATRWLEIGKGATKLAIAAEDTLRNVDTLSTRLDKIGEGIDIAATRSRLNRALSRIKRMSGELEFLQAAYNEAGYSC